jgi:hypothetical protein
VRRQLTDADSGPAAIAVVDEQLARRTWPERSAIGRRLRADPLTSGSPSVWVTVVRVVRHLRHREATRALNEQDGARGNGSYAECSALTPRVREATRNSVRSRAMTCHSSPVVASG